MTPLMVAMLLSSSPCLTSASPVQCKAGDRSTCIHESGARGGGAMIQKPADRDVTEPAKIALLQTPLKSKLENLKADVIALTARVTTLQGLVGISAASTPAALQAVRAQVGQFDHDTGMPKFSPPPASPSASALQGFAPVELPEYKGELHPSKSHGNGQEKFDDVVSKIEAGFPLLMEVTSHDDGTLKVMVEDLEVKIEALKSSVLDLENMVLGSNAVEPVSASKNDTESTSSLASRATIVEMEVASLRTRVASLEQSVTGTQTAHAAVAA